MVYLPYHGKTLRGLQMLSQPVKSAEQIKMSTMVVSAHASL